MFWRRLASFHSYEFHVYKDVCHRRRRLHACNICTIMFFCCRRCISMVLAGALHMISVGFKPRTSFAAWHGKACRDRSAFVCPSRTRITGCLQVENQQNVWMYYIAVAWSTFVLSSLILLQSSAQLYWLKSPQTSSRTCLLQLA
mmetsp:Transcript_71229/g.112813  ORF Transcript_71229/g.112813 Transcript_71229/m.112813 type:complete len:144 (+) Transcript_71229:1594-2025(+)